MSTPFYICEECGGTFGYPTDYSEEAVEREAAEPVGHDSRRRARYLCDVCFDAIMRRLIERTRRAN